MKRKTFRITEYLTGGATTGVRRYIHTNGRMSLEDLLVYTAESKGMEVDDEGHEEIHVVARRVSDAIEAIPDAIKESGKEVRLHERIRFFPTAGKDGEYRLSVQLMNDAFIHSLDDLAVSASGQRRTVRAARPAESRGTMKTGRAAAAPLTCPLTGRVCRLAVE